MAQIAAFGRSQDSDSEGGLERQISHLRDLYENALRLDGAGDVGAAESAYEEVLQHPILSGTFEIEHLPKTAILLRSLTLKNLAALHIKQSRFVPGLNYYILSAQLTPNGWKDCLLLSRIGSCARQLDLLALARQCFERCLNHQPDNCTAIQNLLEIVAECGDEHSYLRLKNYRTYMVRSRWSQHGLERLPDWQKEGGAVSPREFCKRRRVVADVVDVQPVHLVWRYDSADSITFDKLFDFLLFHIDRLYSQRQPVESLTAPISVTLEMSEPCSHNSIPSTSPSQSPGNVDDSANTSSHSEPEDSDDDRIDILVEFLHRAMPQQSPHLDSGRLLFSSRSSLSSPVIEPRSPFDEAAAVRSLMASIPPTSSGIMVVAQRVWKFVTELPPPSLSAERLTTIRQALMNKMAWAASPAEILLAAEITFDHDPMAVGHLIPDLLRHLYDVYIRGCWLLGLWHTHHRRHIAAHLYFQHCAERIGEDIVVRQKCASDRVVSAATIATKLASLSIWELCEGVTAGDNDCVQRLHGLCISGDSVFAGVPHSIQVAAIESIRRRFASNLVLLRLIIASVPPTSFDDSLLPRFSSYLEELIGSEPLSYLPGQLVDEVIQSLSQALYLAIRNDEPIEFVNLITLGLVQFSCRHGALISNHGPAQVELFMAGHKFLSQFDRGCTVQNSRYLHFGLELIDDVTDRPKFDAISGIYCCLYGPLDPRIDCHQGFETIRLGSEPLSLYQCRDLLDYCLATDKFLSEEEKAESSMRIIALLKQLLGSISFPSDLRPNDDFVTNAIADVTYQLPFVTSYCNDHDIFGRFYDHFAQRLVTMHSVCSYATRIIASGSSDMQILTDLLRCDLRLHPRRSRSWYALAWCYLHQRVGFIQGVQAAIDQQLVDAQYEQFFRPLLSARRCLELTYSFLEAESDCIEQLAIHPKLCISLERVLQDQLVLELRLFEYFSRTQNSSIASSQFKRVQRIVRRLPDSPRSRYIRALVLEYSRAPPVEILRQYAAAAESIPDALYAVHALRLDLAQSAAPDWDLIFEYSHCQKTDKSLLLVLEDVAVVFSQLCEQDPEFFRPALRLAQVALCTGSAVHADRAISELSLFINDKTRVRRLRSRKGSLAPNSNDTEFVRALLYDPRADHAEEDCFVSSLVLCRNRGDWEELESTYYNAIRPRRDKQVTLIYATILIATLNEWATTFREHVDQALRDSLFKRAFECCLDLMRGHRDAQVFIPSLLMLPYRIVQDEIPADGDVLPSDIVDHEEVRRARDWCAELQCARSVRNALKRLTIPVGTYNLKHHIRPIQAEFKSFQNRR